MTKIPGLKRARGFSESMLKDEIKKSLSKTSNAPVNTDYLPYQSIIDYMLQGEGKTIQVYQQHLGLPTVEEAYASFFSTYKQDVLTHSKELDENYNRLMGDMQENPPMPEALVEPDRKPGMLPPQEPNHPSFRSQESLQPNATANLAQQQQQEQMQQQQEQMALMQQQAQAQQEEQQEEQQAYYEQQQAEQLRQEQEAQKEAELDAKQEKQIADINKWYEKEKKRIMAGPDFLTKTILWIVFGIMYAVDAIFGMIPFIGDIQAYVISLIGWSVVSLFFGAGLFFYTIKFYGLDLVLGLVLDVIPGLGTAISMVIDFAYEPLRALASKTPMAKYVREYFKDLRGTAQGVPA
jgi:hypothetical protein